MSDQRALRPRQQAPTRGPFPGSANGSAIELVLATGLVDAVDVARVVGTTPRSVYRWGSAAAAPRREAEERLLELAAVLYAVGQVLPGEEARLWLRTPIAPLGWRKPLDVIAVGGYREVADALPQWQPGGR